VCQHATMRPELSRVDVGEVTLSVTSVGEGPLVVLLHGFPEIAYSWRHQLRPLAEAGYRVVAPDGRGYGWSDLPDAVEDYTIFHLVGDVIGLLDTLEAPDAFIVGHDWGAIVAWHVALFRPDRVRGVAALSVPYAPRRDTSIIEHIRRTDPEGPFAYMLAFQEEGVEALLDADPLAVLRDAHWRHCGRRISTPELPDGLPPHLGDGDLEAYGRAFARSGFGGGINWYRNLDRNWARTQPWHGAPIVAPSLFIGGREDFVVSSGDGIGAGVRELPAVCADLRGTVLIEGAGHWVQQEAPDAVNRALLDFFADVG
jgi:pimeloyl-ACP methyl ester carboxylesterase